jgi:thiosulfate reductase cytochrome b subunit
MAETGHAALRTQHSVVVRATHWITFVSFIALVVSGVAILLAHPRLYWGETGNLGMASLVDLPLPFVLIGQSGWGRSLHFLSAWALVLTGLLYVVVGMATRHFREQPHYNSLQRLTYRAVVFALFPLIIWTGLAMSPALTSVAPLLVTSLSGQQSARTIHFAAGCLAVLFLAGHVLMVYRAGFVDRVRAMVMADRPAETERT